MSDRTVPRPPANSRIRPGLRGLLSTYFLVLCLAGAHTGGAVEAEEIGVEEMTSLYTELAAPPCETLPETENGGAGLKCEGPSGFQLLAHDEDARVSMSVVDHLGEVYPLDFWNVVTRGFSSLGPRVEWRLQGGRPMALIVRVEAFEDPERPDRTVSYLVVAKVADRKMCVTDRIPPSNNQNLIAREAADSSTDRPCLKAR